MKTLRFLFAFVLLAIANNTNAQSSYQSFLNGDSIQWYVNILQENTCSEPPINYIFSVSDSLFIDSNKCRKLTYCLSNGNYPHTVTRQFLSEDTLTGQLWLYYCYTNDTTHFKKKLLVDMSLDLGDTFWSPLFYRNQFVDSLSYIVDSILYINGKKHIFLSNKNENDFLLKSNLFIEGVGCSQLPFYPIGYSGLSDWWEELGVLSCCYRNGVSEYRDTFIWYLEDYEDCFFRFNISITYPESIPRITAYPNPTKDRVTLEFGEARFSTLRLVNTAGATVLETTLTGHEPQHTLPLKGLPSGIYSCILSGKDGTATEKIVVE